MTSNPWQQQEQKQIRNWGCVFVVAHNQHCCSSVYSVLRNRTFLLVGGNVKIYRCLWEFLFFKIIWIEMSQKEQLEVFLRQILHNTSCCIPSNIITTNLTNDTKEINFLSPRWDPRTVGLLYWSTFVAEKRLILTCCLLFLLLLRFPHCTRRTNTHHIIIM